MNASASTTSLGMNASASTTGAVADGVMDAVADGVMDAGGRTCTL
jgi:predicted Rossmann-fold nucleotide-binding protein